MVVVIILAIIGLGWQNFFTGVFKGGEKIASSPMVRNVTNEVEEFVANATDDAADEIANRMI
jgi:hypothetical protein